MIETFLGAVQLDRFETLAAVAQQPRQVHADHTGDDAGPDVLK
jgi:hypothetical protein